MVKRKGKQTSKTTPDEDANKRRLAYVKQVADELQRSNSLVAATVASYTALLDGVIAEVAEDVFRAAKADALHCVAVPADVLAATSPVTDPPGPTEVLFPGRGECDLSLEQTECQHCGRRLAATRFAPHLEKCMLGKGRTARAGRKVNYTE